MATLILSADVAQDDGQIKRNLHSVMALPG